MKRFVSLNDNQSNALLLPGTYQSKENWDMKLKSRIKVQIRKWPHAGNTVQRIRLTSSWLPEERFVGVAKQNGMIIKSVIRKSTLNRKVKLTIKVWGGMSNCHFFFVALLCAHVWERWTIVTGRVCVCVCVQAFIKYNNHTIYSIIIVLSIIYRKIFWICTSNVTSFWYEEFRNYAH